MYSGSLFKESMRLPHIHFLGNAFGFNIQIVQNLKMIRDKTDRRNQHILDLLFFIQRLRVSSMSDRAKAPPSGQRFAM